MKCLAADTGSGMMEPFALKQQRKPRTPWIIAAACAILFGIWQFDIVPRVRSAASGTIPTGTVDSEMTALTSVGEPWDEIVDRDRDQATGESESFIDDPVLSALASQQSPLDIRLTEPAGQLPAERRESPLRSGSIQPVSFEIESNVGQEDAPAATVIPAELAQRLREIDQLYRDEFILEAHAELSQIYWREPALRTLIRARIEHTASLIYTSPDRQFDEPYLVQPGDTLSSIAAKHNVTWQYLARLNRTSPERLQAGQQLKVLKGPFSAVVDLDDFALTVHAHGWFVHRYRIGIGRDRRTPSGEFTVQEKLENPTWYNPDGGQIGPEDPENPLGRFWLGLGNHIGIHGTNDPSSVGKAMSRGCLHLADQDIEEVFHLLSTGSTVLIRN